MTIGADFTSFASTLQRADTATRGPARTNLQTQALDSAGRTAATSGTHDGPDFAEAVQAALEGVNAQQLRGQDAAEAYANGDRNDIHGTMIAIEQADIGLRLVSNIRSRLVEAYREVMRMGA